ncbi:DUF1801 domain-containing protein [Terrimonas rubra]|uniref:DUF1801 domain-containing protein n=1 Tax=Terrimonas rubra TaxID=1035890 RepID=A0ABW6A9Y3_9BACT
MAKPAQIKTKPTTVSVDDFIAAVTNEQQRKDSQTIRTMMEKASGAKAKMWGASLIGFGDKRYKSAATGREVDWFIIGFSPRKANLSLHLAINLEKQAATLQKLGKHKTGAGCIYIHKLEDVDTKVLQELINTAVKVK